MNLLNIFLVWLRQPLNSKYDHAMQVRRNTGILSSSVLLECQEPINCLFRSNKQFTHLKLQVVPNSQKKNLKKIKLGASFFFFLI